MLLEQLKYCIDLFCKDETNEWINDLDVTLNKKVTRDTVWTITVSNNEQKVQCLKAKICLSKGGEGQLLLSKVLPHPFVMNCNDCSGIIIEGECTELDKAFVDALMKVDKMVKDAYEDKDKQYSVLL